MSEYWRPNRATDWYGTNDARRTGKAAQAFLLRIVKLAVASLTFVVCVPVALVLRPRKRHAPVHPLGRSLVIIRE